MEGSKKTAAEISLCRRPALTVDQFIINNLRCSAADIFHSSNPSHLVLCFELLGLAFTLRHLFYQPRKHFSAYPSMSAAVFAQQLKLPKRTLARFGACRAFLCAKAVADRIFCWKEFESVKEYNGIKCDQSQNEVCNRKGFKRKAWNSCPEHEFKIYF